MLMVITASTFISVLLLAAAIGYPLVARRAAIQERLARVVVPKGEKLFLVSTRPPLQVWLAHLGERLPWQGKESFTYGKLLAAAGFKKDVFHIWAGSKAVCALVLPGLYLLLVAMPHGTLLHPTPLLKAAALGIAGFLVPTFWLRNRVRRRQTAMFHSLPDFLDLLTICVESGLSIDAALVKTAENPLFRGDPLADELKTAVMEVRAGKPRNEAFKDMAERTMMDDINVFVTMLIQTEKFGTSLGQTMRIHSHSLRTKRKQHAEEAAAKTAVQILFPLVFFIFPALLIVILGPALFKIFAFIN